MRTLSLITASLVSLTLFARTPEETKRPRPENQTHSGAGLTDSLATLETRALFYNLRELARSKLLFGHQDTTAYGVGWSAEDGRSDVKSVTGSYPAVYGWDKIPALTEVGPGNGLPADRASSFFTRHLLEPLKKDKVAGRIAYALLWRNGSRRHFWTPYPGHPDAEDLRSFHADAFTVFEDDLPDVYKLPPREGE